MTNSDYEKVEIEIEKNQLEVEFDIESGRNSGGVEGTNGSRLEITSETNMQSSTSTDNEKNPELTWFQLYVAKFKGVDGKKSAPMASVDHILISSVLAFTGIFLVAVSSRWYLTTTFKVDGVGVNLLTGSYAATSVLLYDGIHSPFAQPRNVVGSYTVASFVGVVVRIICGYIGLPMWVTGPLAAGFSVIGMNLTKTVHPPGGACGLIAVIGGPSVVNLGFGYVLTSFGAAFMMTCVALIGNNLVANRQYPQYWW